MSCDRPEGHGRWDRKSAVKPRNRAYIPIWVRLYESRTELSVIGIVGEGRGFCGGGVSASRGRCGEESGIELNSDYYYNTMGDQDGAAGHDNGLGLPTFDTRLSVSRERSLGGVRCTVSGTRRSIRGSAVPWGSIDICPTLDAFRHRQHSVDASPPLHHRPTVWWSADGEVVGCSIAPAAHHAAASAHHAALGPPRPC